MSIPLCWQDTRNCLILSSGPSRRTRYLAGVGPDCDVAGDDASQDGVIRSGSLRGPNELQSKLRSSSTTFFLGIGLPSSISRDLRPSTSSISRGAPGDGVKGPGNRKTHDDIPLPAHLPNSPTFPIVSDSSGSLSKVVGSLVEPAASRNRWACSGCGTIFARDSTIYVPPASAAKQRTRTTDEELFFCKQCYTTRYALGNCSHPACGKPVLGSTRETAVYIKAGQEVYHGTCFRCMWCDAGALSKKGAKDIKVKEIMMDLNGYPCCEECFGRIPKDPKLLTKAKQSTHVSNATMVSPREQRDRPIDSAISELADRLRIPLTGVPRSRSKSPEKDAESATLRIPGIRQLEEEIDSPNVEAVKCASCGKGAFDVPWSLRIQQEVVLVTLPISHFLHAECFQCAICSLVLDANKAFVKLKDDNKQRTHPPLAADRKLPQWAHPTCAPRAKIDWKFRDRRLAEPPVAAETAHRRRAHPTEQRLPRPSLSEVSKRDVGSKASDSVAIHSFIHRLYVGTDGVYSCSPSPSRGVGSTSRDGHKSEAGRGSSSRQATWSTPPTPAVRQFKPSSGAAPPTRNTLNVHHPGGLTGENPARGTFATNLKATGSTLPPSLPGSMQTGAGATNAKARQSKAVVQTASSPSSRLRYGGMLQCSGCSGRLTSLESVLGPAGSSWHRKCLVCKAAKPTKPAPTRYASALSSQGEGLCGKQLDSFAKVREDGEVRCTSCYREDI